MHIKPFCQLKFSMPHLTAACFGKSEQKSVHPFARFGKVGARRGTFMSVVRKKPRLFLISASWKGVCQCIWKFQLPLMLEIGICVLMLIFSVALCKHGEPRFKTPCDYLTLKCCTLVTAIVDTHLRWTPYAFLRRH